MITMVTMNGELTHSTVLYGTVNLQLAATANTDDRILIK